MRLILDLNLPGYIAQIVAALILSIKGNRKRSLVSVPVNDKPVKMSTYVKRYRCFDCDTSFSDVNPISYEDWSFTRTAIISILNRLKPYNATYASIARSFGVSSTRIMEIFDTFVRVKRHASS